MAMDSGANQFLADLFGVPYTPGQQVSDPGANDVGVKTKFDPAKTVMPTRGDGTGRAQDMSRMMAAVEPSGTMDVPLEELDGATPPSGNPAPNPGPVQQAALNPIAPTPNVNTTPPATPQQQFNPHSNDGIQARTAEAFDNSPVMQLIRLLMNQQSQANPVGSVGGS